MRATIIMLCTLAGATLALAGCKGTEPDASGAAVVTVPTSPASPASVTGGGDPTATTTSSPIAGAPPPASSARWVMPNLVGGNLQSAQDQIQALTGNPLFITLSHDATGRGRNQVLDANWKVCSQNIAPGKSFTDNSTIDFGAVKLTEKCP